MLKSNSNQDTFYDNIVSRLKFLESRNPDLSALMRLLDNWLERYISQVSSASESAEDRDVVQPTILINPSENVIREEVVTVSVPTLSPAHPDNQALSEPARSTSNNMLRAEEVEQLEKRLLLKIEASRWAMERDRLLKKTSIDYQTEIEPRDHALLAQARELTNCYLWMNNPDTAPSLSKDSYEMLATAYASAAKCVHFLRYLSDLTDKSPQSEVLNRILRDALYITATAQSALRRVTYEVSGREDQDQIRIHRWLTLLTKKYSIYVNRHMKKDSLAPVDRIYVIPEYIDRLKNEVEKLGQKQKILSEGFGRIQYHAARINSVEGSSYDWGRIIRTVEELVDAGVRPSDERFAQHLNPILQYMKKPPTYKEHPFFVNVLMELDYWRGDVAQKELVRQEAHASPIRPSVDPDQEDSAATYMSVWDEMEGITLSSGGIQPAARVPEESAVEKPPLKIEEVSPADISFVPFSAKKVPFGMGILNASEEKRPHLSPTEEVLSYARVVAGSVTPGSTPLHVPSAEEEQELITKARVAIGSRTILLVDGGIDDETTFYQSLQKTLQTPFVFAGAAVVQSEAKLAQLVHPGAVAIVLMIDGTVSPTNRNVENYCRRFDKPLLRLDTSVSIASAVRQIIAALTLWQ
ncbi:MAG: hypothetical protein Q4D38_04050 [Planctomycetia bacterium]|nr:hypothetical protein [Planctomycetia bacterium]